MDSNVSIFISLAFPTHVDFLLALLFCLAAKCPDRSRRNTRNVQTRDEDVAEIDKFVLLQKEQGRLSGRDVLNCTIAVTLTFSVTS